MPSPGLFLVGSPDSGATKKIIKTDADGKIVVASGGASETTLAAVLAKLSADPATETTLGAILEAIQGQEPHTDVLYTTHHDATTETSNGEVADVTEYASIGFTVEGTFGTAEVEFQASIDGETFYPLYCNDAAMGGNSGTSTDTAGLYSADVRGYTHVRAAITGATTGTELTVKSVAISAQRSGSPLVNISDREDRELGKVSVTGSLPALSASETDIGRVQTNNRELVMRVYDEIIATIGAENILLLLPLWEETGETVVRDLLRSHIAFKVSNPDKLGNAGLLHRCPVFSNDYIQQMPVTESTVTGSYAGITDGTYKLAQRIEPITTAVGFVRAQVNTVGSLPNATIKLSICEDNEGVPGDTIKNGVCEAYKYLSYLSSTTRMQGFYFPTPPQLYRGNVYWLVLEYDDPTGVDSENYINWQHGGSDYGQVRAVYDGEEWAVIQGENHTFDLFSDDVVMEEGSVIVACKYTGPVSNTSTIIGTSSYIGSDALSMGYSNIGAFRFTCRIGGNAYTLLTKNQVIDRDVVLGSAFFKDASTKKRVLYMDNLEQSSQDGVAGGVLNRFVQPLNIGNNIYPTTQITQRWVGTIGPVIITKKPLTAQQHADVAHLLLLHRKMRG